MSALAAVADADAAISKKEKATKVTKATPKAEKRKG